MSTPSLSSGRQEILDTIQAMEKSIEPSSKLPTIQSPKSGSVEPVVISSLVESTTLNLIDESSKNLVEAI